MVTFDYLGNHYEISYWIYQLIANAHVIFGIVVGWLIHKEYVK